jgi:exopolysaccharide biosynthesis operon protein EpsL
MPAQGELMDKYRLIPMALVTGIMVLGGTTGLSQEIVAKDPFSVDITQTFLRDNNIFRLPDGRHPAPSVNDGSPDGPRDDTVSSTALNGHFEHDYSLQHLSANIALVHERYDEYDYLDNTAKGGGLAWDWAIGRHLTGTMAATQSESLRSFADSASTERSLNTYRRYFVDANYWWHPLWSAGIGARKITSRYSDEASSGTEYDEDAVEAKITFRSSSSNRIALVVIGTDGSYPGRSELQASLFDSGYEQTSAQLQGDWRLSGQSRVNGYLGHTWRDYDHLSQRDFSGLTGRLGYDWLASEKVGIKLQARKEVGAESDLVDNHVVTTAISVDPYWNLSDEISLSVGAEFYRRDYRGDPEPGMSEAPPKNDTTQQLQAGCRYAPSRHFNVTLMVQKDQRDSRNTSREYSSTQTSVAGQLIW